MKKKKTKLLFFCAIFVVICILGGITELLIGDAFWLFRARNVPFPENIVMREENQVIVRDEYTIELMQSFYKGRECYAVFRVVNDMGDVSNEMVNKWGVKLNGNTFGDGRFALCPKVTANTSVSVDAELDNGTLYVYYSISGFGKYEPGEIGDEGIKIYLFDSMSDYEELIYEEHTYVDYFLIEEMAE